MPYEEKMLQEFIETVGMNDNTVYQAWLRNKKNELENYLIFLKYMGLDLDRFTVELNKGAYDSICNANLDGGIIFEISKYADTIKNNNVIKYTGELVVDGDTPRIFNGNYSSVPTENFLTYLVDIADYNENIKKLLTLKKEIFIGYYTKMSNLKLKYYEKNMKEVKELLKANNIEYTSEYERTYDMCSEIIKTKRYI